MTLDRPGAVELWLLDREACRDALAAIETATPRLADDEIARAGAQPDGEIWRTGRIALRLLLEVRLGLALRRRPLAVSTSGRPALPECVGDFSVADSGAYLLIGLSRTDRIGVDVERARPLRMSQRRLALVRAAGEALGGAPASPLECWTRIEAFAKATGPTLAATLAGLGVQGHGDGVLAPEDVTRRARDRIAAAGCAITDLVLPNDLVGAVCHASTITITDRRPRRLDEGAIAQLAG